MAGSQVNSLTDEQRKILECFSINRDRIISAYAGSGKTFILKRIAEIEECVNKKIVYIAFNKSIVEESREAFGRNVFPTTMHSLAYRASPKWLLAKLSPKATSLRDLKNYLNFDSLFNEEFKNEPSNAIFNERDFVQASLETLRRFEISGLKAICEYHIPFVWKSKMTVMQKDKVIEMANAIWDAKISIDTTLPIQHDTYVKYWQLNDPVIDCDLILFDEAQDSSGVFASILDVQTCTKIYVGDRHQQIYSWRGATNAMEKLNGEEFRLTKSFRFGPELAKFATQIMSIKKGKYPPVQGHEEIETKVHFGSHPRGEIAYTHIFRTNGSIIEASQSLLANDVQFTTNVDFRRLLRQIECAYALYRGDPIPHRDPTFEGISTWDELIDLSEINQELVFLKNFINKNKHYSVKIIRDVFYGLMDMQKSFQKPRVILTTGHKSKGLEWENVLLDKDFKMFFPKDDKDFETFSFDEEVNLLYVAATRATKNLYVPVEIQSLVNKFSKK